MVLSEQAMRNWKVASYVLATFGGVQAVFFTEYEVPGFEGQRHVFSGIQDTTRQYIDKYMYGIETAAPPTPQQSAAQSSTSSTSSSGKQ
mmetsp:Transcript_20205/g.55784  ORF Transcript_20205/g.55784 Transcript_20205/m.55784 type:complete len:89 (+) Transcript_20205:32-298(+)